MNRTGVWWCRAALVLALSTASAAPSGSGGPQRIVSLNVCTDQLLMLLVPHQRIAAVSFLAADPMTSVMVEQARRLRRIQGHAEQVLALDPDLIVAGTYAARPAVRLLRRVGHEVLDLPPATSVPQIIQNLRRLGEAVGESATAEDLVRDMQAYLETLSSIPGGQRPLFVNYNLNGYTSGRGTLLSDLAHRAGFDVAGDRLGFDGMRAVSLEQLIQLDPEIMDLGRRWDDPPALASQSLHHPALRAVLDRTHQVELDERYWSCGLPASLEVVAALRAARLTLGSGS